MKTNKLQMLRIFFSITTLVLYLYLLYFEYVKKTSDSFLKIIKVAAPVGLLLLSITIICENIKKKEK